MSVSPWSWILGTRSLGAKSVIWGVGTTDPPGRTASRMANMKSLIAGGFQGGCAIQVDFFYEMLKENNQVR